MLGRTLTLLEDGVELKRRGRYWAAIEKYKLAIEGEPEKEAILYTSLAKSQYLASQGEASVNSYIMGLVYKLAEYNDEHERIERSQMLDESYQSYLLEKFFNINLHLAHSYIDYQEGLKIDLAKMINGIVLFKITNPSLNEVLNTFEEIMLLVNYNIKYYRWVLAGGAIAEPPEQPSVYGKYDIDFAHVYITQGTHIAQRLIQWEKIQKFF